MQSSATLPLEGAETFNLASTTSSRRDHGGFGDLPVELPPPRNRRGERKYFAENTAKLNNTTHPVPSALSKILKVVGIALTAAGIVILVPISFHLPYGILNTLLANGGAINNPLTLPLLEKILAAIAGDVSLLLASLTLIATGSIVGKASKWVADPDNKDNEIGIDSLAILLTAGAAAAIGMFNGDGSADTD
ncbi:hypothetical protein SCG7109_AT_00020 [Chlamydiales bacterium SCGC AG-110-M15]|nr:hypothetical protein SCG7109_AT_00020 [Chlamydiales bacterium SCGC AG-110-M15]